MNEARAAVLGLGAIAAVTFALAATLVVNSVVARKRPAPVPADSIERTFLAARADGPSTVEGLDRLLPAGTPRTRVLARLASAGFACTFEPNAATCFRSIGGGGGTDIWTIWLTFDSAETLTSSQGERRRARP